MVGKERVGAAGPGGSQRHSARSSAWRCRTCPVPYAWTTPISEARRKDPPAIACLFSEPDEKCW